MPSFRALGAAVILAGTGLWISGCDTATGKADKQVRQNIAVAAAQINGSEQDQSAADSTLLMLSQQTDASPASRIEVEALRGQLALRKAEQLQPKIDGMQAEILP